MSPAIAAQLDRLAGLSSAELKERWRRIVGDPVPRVSPSLLRLALAWELQAHALGGLSRTTRAALAALDKGTPRAQVPQAGTRLVRTWQGKMHVVTIGEDRVIRWEERSYRSLSEVARAITGTRWSGPAFFGLKPKAAA